VPDDVAIRVQPVSAPRPALNQVAERLAGRFDGPPPAAALGAWQRLSMTDQAVLAYYGKPWQILAEQFARAGDPAAAKRCAQAVTALTPTAPRDDDGWASAQ